MGKRVRVFLNESSGAGCDAEEIEALFARHDCACSITRLSRGVDAGRMAKEDATEVVFVAAGGDGTVNVVASAIAGTPRCMGVLPVGTLNHFGKDLGLPLELKEAVAAIARGMTCGVDAGEVNGQIFVNNSSIGAYPAMVVDRERMKKAGREQVGVAGGWRRSRRLCAFAACTVELRGAGRGSGAARRPSCSWATTSTAWTGPAPGPGRERLDHAASWRCTWRRARRADDDAAFHRGGGVPRPAAAAAGAYQEYKAKSIERWTRAGASGCGCRSDGEVKRRRGPLRSATHPGSLQVIGANVRCGGDRRDGDAGARLGCTLRARGAGAGRGVCCTRLREASAGCDRGIRRPDAAREEAASSARRGRSCARCRRRRRLAGAGQS